MSHCYCWLDVNSSLLDLSPMLVYPNHPPSPPLYADFVALCTSLPDFLLCCCNNSYGYQGSLPNKKSIHDTRKLIGKYFDNGFIMSYFSQATGLPVWQKKWFEDFTLGSGKLRWAFAQFCDIFLNLTLNWFIMKITARLIDLENYH